MKISPLSYKNGFTLIEIIVAVGIFSLVMFISMGAITSVVSANRKSASLRSVMDNLNFTIEGMTRSIRFGTNYHCDNVNYTNTNQPVDCPAGASSMTVLDSSGNLISYSIVNGQIMKSVNNGSASSLNSPDTNIQSMSFRVFNSCPYTIGSSGCSVSDLAQPKVIIVIKGTVTSGPSVSSTFILQTTVSQRNFDFQ